MTLRPHLFAALMPLLAPGARSADAAPTRAPELAPAFRDHMVLQRGVAHPVFGRAQPGARITVRFAGQAKGTVADAAGRWRVALDPLEAGGAGRDLVVESAGGRAVRTDLLVGEVWICAGQSNMALPLGESAGGAAAAAEAAPPGLRLCNPRPRLDQGARPWRADEATALRPGNFFTPAEWTDAAADRRRSFSAVGWYFGAMLARQARVPVGLVHVAVGGSPTESWTPRAAILADPSLAGLEKDWPESAGAQSFVHDRAALHLRAAVAAGAAPHALEHPFRAGFLFEAGLRPFLELPVAGVLWYQGESNAEDASAQERIFPLFVAAVRRHAGRPELPVLGVQLPGLDRACWPEFREAQAKLLHGPGLGFVTTLDAGDPADVHPKDKRPVGERLARLALRRVYGDPVAGDPPAPAGYAFAGGAARIALRGAATLRPPPAGRPAPFWVCGADKVFFRADAALRDGALIVSSPRVPEPVAVRYAWEADPAPVLFSPEGPPAAPFRSDDWPAIRVACIGDSITAGAGLPGRSTYPAVLSDLAGPLFDVRNFGDPGSSVGRALKRGDGTPRGYADTFAWRRAGEFAPDVVICNLGANDVLDDRFSARDFTRDYLAILAPFTGRKPPPRIVLWRPLAPIQPGHRFHRSPRLAPIEAAIGEVVQAAGASAFDANTPLAGHPDWFPDHLHPDADGAAALARAVAARLRGLGLPVPPAE